MNGLHHRRQPTHPQAFQGRAKPRRLPLVLRITKGAIHLSVPARPTSQSVLLCLGGAKREQGTYSVANPDYAAVQVPPRPG